LTPAPAEAHSVVVTDACPLLDGCPRSLVVA
jgi:hypothetical protein